MEATANSTTSKKKTPNGTFYGSADGFFSQKKKVVLGNIKHSGNKRNIFLSKSGSGNSIYSNVESLSDKNENISMSETNGGSLLGSAATTSKTKQVNTGAAVEGKLATAKTQLIKKIFSTVNGFRGATTPSKFEGIIQSIFISKKSMEMATSLAREKGIDVNSNLKRQRIRSDWAVVIKEILMNTPKEMIIAVLAKFGEIKPAAFGDKFWAQVVSLASPSGDLYFSSSARSDLSPPGFSGFKRNMLVVQSEFSINNCLALLECSLELLVDQVSDIMCRLNGVKLVPLVPITQVVPPATPVPTLVSPDTDMILDVPWSSLFPSSLVLENKVADLGLSSSKVLTSKVGSLESKIMALEISIGSILGKFSDALFASMSKLIWRVTTCNVRGMTNLAKQEDIICWHKDSRNMISIVTETKLRSNIRSWIMNKFDGLWVFTFGLNIGFHGAGVAIIMNNSLAWHVLKVDEVPSHLISVHLLFKNKLSVMILGLYAGVSISTQFSQTADINSMISKAVNSSSFVVLSGDFNENRSNKSVSFKFCLDVEKVIDFILVSENLVSAMASHFVNGVSEFFDTDHKSVSVSIGLGGLLDTHFISVCRQANQDQWRFKLKDANNVQWLSFKDCSSAKFLARLDMFEEARVNSNLNTMWKLLKETIIQTVDTVFSRIWYSEYDCLKNKQSSKFFKLELLVAKVVKCWNFGDLLNFNHLIKIWLAVDTVKASKVDSMILNSISSMELIKHLSVIKKEYHKSKYYKSKIVEDTAIRKAIDHHIENLCSDKGKMIKSILECPFCKVVLDYLIVDDELVVEPNKVKLKIDKIMKE
ncbi:hypothetical protein G9A89_005615 [Geosiphon pyriformis]|nr:hypothetical protein G9A89_005615 [Geosiphon pyriformis]